VIAEEKISYETVSVAFQRDDEDQREGVGRGRLTFVLLLSHLLPKEVDESYVREFGSITEYDRFDFRYGRGKCGRGRKEKGGKRRGKGRRKGGRKGREEVQPVGACWERRKKQKGGDGFEVLGDGSFQGSIARSEHPLKAARMGV